MMACDLMENMTLDGSQNGRGCSIFLTHAQQIVVSS